MNLAQCAESYNRAFPNRPGLLADAGMIVGCWMIGACYKSPNDLYGAYPRGYLGRVHAMFPEARNVLHVFSGGLTLDAAYQAAGLPDWKTCHVDKAHIELVDIHGPEQGRYPTWQGDVLSMPEEWTGRYDLILADPPYTAEDAAKYDCPAPNRRKIMESLRRVAAPGANLVWLDQCWPQHRKDQWKTWGTVGLVRSTNHRMRLVSFFEAV